MTNSENAVATFLRERLAEAKRVGGESNFLDSKFFEMVLRGDAKLSLDRVEEVASTLNCNARHLFRLAAGQFYGEDTIRFLERMLGPPLTDAEQMWLNAIRSANEGPVLAPSGTAKRLVRALAKPYDSE